MVKSKDYNSANQQLYMDTITIDTEISNGKPVISGTRVRVEDVLDLLSQNKTISEISSEYDITQQQVLDAVAYARDQLSRQISLPA